MTADLSDTLGELREKLRLPRADLWLSLVSLLNEVSLVSLLNEVSAYN